MFNAFFSTLRSGCLAVLLCGLAGTGAWAQTTVSANLDYAEGKYGEADTSTSWTLPLIVKHQLGAFALKLNMPYVRVTGTAASGGDRFSASRQVQEGFGDVAATATYDVFTDAASGMAVDVGVKAKFATADKRNHLITTGKNDYSLLVDALRPFGATQVFATLGWTRKGDPEGIDYRNPWFGTVGLSRKLGDTVTLGGYYDYRQKVTATGDPVSEATVFLERRLTAASKAQV